MSELENKLIELGYRKAYNYTLEEKPFVNYVKYLKFERNNPTLYISIEETTNNIEGWIQIQSHFIVNQQDIDNLQQAFNQLQKDLEELKKYESNI